MLTFFSRFDAHSHSKTCFFLKFFTSCPRPQLQLSTKIMIIHQMESRKLWSTGCCFNGLYMWDIMEYIIYIYTYHIYIHIHMYICFFLYHTKQLVELIKINCHLAWLFSPNPKIRFPNRRRWTKWWARWSLDRLGRVDGPHWVVSGFFRSMITGFSLWLCQHSYWKWSIYRWWTHFYSGDFHFAM